MKTVIPAISIATHGPSAHALTPLDLKRKITTKQAAELNSVSEDFFKRNYRHLIRKIGPRRNAVELGDAINLPPKPTKQNACGPEAAAGASVLASSTGNERRNQ